jgi:hypothetical protein
MLDLSPDSMMEAGGVFSARIPIGERMSVREARTYGEAADIAARDGGNVRIDLVPEYILAMSALWLQERATQIELTKLRERIAEMEAK